MHIPSLLSKLISRKSASLCAAGCLTVAYVGRSPATFKKRIPIKQIDACRHKNLFQLAVFAAVVFLIIPAAVVKADDFQSEFWSTQFGVAYTPNQSGLALSNGVANDGCVEWQVSAIKTGGSDGPQIVGTGSFFEDFRSDNITELNVSEPILSAAGLAVYSHYAVSGKFISSAGVQQSTYGILSEIARIGDGGSGFVFLPMGIAEDLAFAADAAATVGALFSDPPQALQGPTQIQQGPPGWRDCAAEESLCIKEALAKCVACMISARADWKMYAAGCMLASAPCLALTPAFYVVCVLACEATAFAWLTDKLSACKYEFEAAKLGCANLKLQCDSFNSGLLGGRTGGPTQGSGD